MNSVNIVLLMLMLGAVTGIASRYIKGVPLPIIQIAIGALLAWPQKGLHIAFDPDLFLLLFIPPLLFGDGWRIPKRESFALYKPILLLAFGLVFFTVIGLGYIIHWVIPGMSLPVAFTLAAIVSPTDTVAVSAITRGLGMPPKTMNVLQGESLLNDASGLVALKFAVAAAVTGLFSWTQAVQEFLWVAIGGVVAGALLGWGFAKVRDFVTRHVGDLAATQMVLLVHLLPFLAYMTGEFLDVSGILAAVAAGVATNMAEMNRTRFVSERLQMAGVYEMLETTFNGTIFLLLGLQLPTIIRTTMQSAGDDWWVLLLYVLAIAFGLLLLRWIWLMIGVQGSLWKAHLDGKMDEKPSPLLTLASTLAGIRGAVTLAAALSIPLTVHGGGPFPSRDLLIFLAAGTIIVTLIVGSVGLPLILRKLPPLGMDPVVMEEKHARLVACEAAVSSLTMAAGEAEKHTETWNKQYSEVAGRVTEDYRKRIDFLTDETTSDTEETSEMRARSERARVERRGRYIMELRLRLQCLDIERQTLYDECRKRHINDESLRHLVRELDFMELTLKDRLQAAVSDTPAVDD